MAQKLEEYQVRNRVTRRQAVGLDALVAAGLVFAEPVTESIEPSPARASIFSATPAPEVMYNCRAVLTRNGAVLQERVYQAIHDHSEVRHYDGFTLTIDCQPV